MRYEPSLNLKINKFKNTYSYEDLNLDKTFEYFVNYNIIEMSQPNSIQRNLSLIEFVSVGGSNDMGIDGIAIKVNNFFVTTKTEIDNIISLHKKVNIEFLFIQSKNTSKIDCGEYLKFLNGVYDFSNSNHFEPYNEKIAVVLELKDYIFSDEIMQTWDNSPILKVFYVVRSDSIENEYLNAKTQNARQNIDNLNIYSDILIRNIGNEQLIKICEENERKLEIVINVLGTLEFEEVEGVNNSLVTLCKASEVLKILMSEEGEIRRNLFTDNVRDYQGETFINTNILNTAKNESSLFLLLNNGITIVCSTLISSNRKITLINPQIVNGCQTSYILFQAHKEKADLSQILVNVKLIATANDKIINSIIKGTNSQNPVYISTFEITKEFHKNFENFINDFQQESQSRIYYERRSKQYAFDPNIKKSKIFGLDTLAHSIVSVFLESPHEGVLHIEKLLEKYQNSIFVEGQSFLPYYTAIKILLELEAILRHVDYKNFETYKYYILLMIFEKTAGIPYGLNYNKIDEYCNKVLNLFKEEKAFWNITQICFKQFNLIKSEWIKQFGDKYAYGIKDNKDFTKFFLANLHGSEISDTDFPNDCQIIEYRGEVISVKQDKHGNYYAFISRFPENIFAHEKNNPNIDFSELLYKTVTYTITKNQLNGKDKAKNLKIV